MIAEVVGCHPLNVFIHGLEYFIQHADENDPLEREYICSAIVIVDSLREIMNEERKKRKQRKLNP